MSGRKNIYFLSNERKEYIKISKMGIKIPLIGTTTTRKDGYLCMVKIER